jgi:hypothetical protein
MNFKCPANDIFLLLKSFETIFKIVNMLPLIELDFDLNVLCFKSTLFFSFFVSFFADFISSSSGLLSLEKYGFMSFKNKPNEN